VEAREEVRGGGILLSNQTVADLVTPEKDYGPTLETCCRFHWHFNVTRGEDQEHFAALSGYAEVLEKTRTKTFDWGVWATTSISEKKGQVERIPLNEVKRVSSDPRLSFFINDIDEDWYQYGAFPQIIESDFHITRAEYERRKAMRWPEADEGMIVTRMPAPPPPPAPEPPLPPVETIGRPRKNEAPSRRTTK